MSHFSIFRPLAVALVLVSLSAPAMGADPARPAPQIQMAILLDTSNSMDALIDEARSKLWRIVNELARARRDGQRPDLKVALIQYGSNELPAAEGSMRLVVPLTDDLDRISEALFQLRTPKNGRSSEEWCGMALQSAVRDLLWSSRDDALKCIFIAGNEPFEQGPVDFRKVCPLAREKGITISTIYCGPREKGLQENWALGAELGGGSYLAIDPGRDASAPAAFSGKLPPGFPAAPVFVQTSPADGKLAELSHKLNATYLAYGSAQSRQEYCARQLTQDKLAGASAVVAAERAAFKATALYRNGHWDLVDAVRDARIKLADLKADELPEELRSLKPAEIERLLAAKAEERKTLQAQIDTLAKEREAHLALARALHEKELSDWQAALRKHQGSEASQLVASPAAKSLDQAILESIRNQAVQKHFRFE